MYQSYQHYFFAMCLMLTAALLPGVSHANEVAMTAEVQTVNINEADAETLSSLLVGVGRTRAEAIVRYREEFGPYYTAEDLLQVKGIGKSTLERNRSRITME